MNIPFLGGLLDRWLRHQKEQVAQPLTDREKVFANPRGYTRRSRRAVGYLKPVWAEEMRAMRAANSAPPRYVRRHLLAVMEKAKTRRVRKARARIMRVIARQGVEVAL